MRFRTSIWSDAHDLVFYDPAAIAPDSLIAADLDLGADFDPTQPATDLEAEVERLVAAGNAVAVRFVEGGFDDDIVILVDEPIDPRFAERGTKILDGAIFRIPSGNLTVGGSVCLTGSDGQSRRTVSSDSFEIPAGNYAAQLYSLVPWLGRWFASEYHQQTTKLQRAAGPYFTLVQAFGIVAWVLVAAVASSGLILWLAISWLFGSRQDVTQAASVLAVYSLVMAGARALFHLAQHIPLLNRDNEVLKALREENPPLVVCLTRVDGEPMGNPPAMAIVGSD